LALQNILGDSTTIYCFEPSAGTYKELQANIKEMKNIEALNFGLSERHEQLTLHSTDESDGLASIYGNNPLTAFPHRETICLTTLDDFCRNRNIQEIDFLKLDVEGHEYKVLLGSREMLTSGKIKIIQFEIGECNIVSRVFFKDFFELLNNQYMIYRVLPRGIRFVEEYKTINEIFACVNYIAISRALNINSAFGGAPPRDRGRG